jgi:hypothetical protein
MATPQQRYYQSHREAILPKMREREKTRRETRKSKYNDDPTLHEEDKAIARRKYYARVGRINKTIIDEALGRPDLPDATRTVLLQLTEDSSAISTAALRKMISPPPNKQMPRGVKKVVEDVKKEDSVVVPVVPPVEEEKKDEVVKKEKVKKEKKEKRVIATEPGEVLHIKIEKGVTVRFD